jgi:nitrite reductase/ring-hydroxylating ferredoxin subunit
VTTEEGWIYVMDEVALPEGVVVPAYPLGLNVIVVRIDGTIYAMSGRCPHMGCPLFMGSLTGAILTCPCHNWRFDVRTGYFLDAPEVRTPLYQIRSDEGKLYVNIK